jgi:hypothetical protein
MNWTKALVLVMAAAVLAAPASALPELSTTTVDVQDYAAREAQAADLEGFTGGWHGVVITIAAIVLVIWLLTSLFDGDSDSHRHHDHAPVHP